MTGANWRLYVALILLGGTLLLSILHVLVFGETRTFLFYLTLDVAFVPIQVLLVTVIIERLLRERERRAMMSKLYMVIGAFFSEAGSELIRRTNEFCAAGLDQSGLRDRLAVRLDWREEDFRTAAGHAEANVCRLDHDAAGLESLKTLLLDKRAFILGLLQNPNLLEHEQFTDLLWAVCHLTEELAARPALDGLPPSDLEHLRVDIRRAFNLLVREWLAYMFHLKTEYPYIYSLAVRTNPFNPSASAVIS